MKILIACELSGRVRDALLALGHDAWSCDLYPSESTIYGNSNHLEGDVRTWLFTGEWDMLIAFPPCTYICNSGVRWLHPTGGNPELYEKTTLRWNAMWGGAEFFRTLLNAPIDKIAIENPIPHKYALDIIGRKYDQTIQPWQFGEDASKRTCLWLKNLPPLIPTKIIKKKRYANQTPSGQNNLGPSPERAKLRGMTYQGIANAIAEQWTPSIIKGIS